MLEKLAAEMYASSLSPRDIEDDLFEAIGSLILSIKASKRWRRVLMGEMGLKRIDALRKELGIEGKPLQEEKRKRSGERLMPDFSFL